MTDITDVQTMLGTLSTIFFPDQVRTIFTGEGMVPNPATPATPATATLSSLETHKWNLFMDSSLFQSTFSNQIKTDGASNVHYLLAKDDKFRRVPLDKIPSRFDESIISVIFSEFVPYISTTPGDSGETLSLRTILDDITGLIDYDYSTFRSQKVLSYQVDDDGKQLLSEIPVDFSAEDSQDRFSLYLNNIDLINKNANMKSRISFFVFRRLLLLLKVHIHLQIAIYIEQKFNLPLDYRPLSNGVKSILKNINVTFDDDANDKSSYNYNDYRESAQSLTTVFYNNVGDIRSNNVQMKSLQGDIEDQFNQKLTVEQLKTKSMYVVGAVVSIFLAAIGYVSYSFSKSPKHLFMSCIHVFLITLFTSVSVYAATKYYSMERFETVSTGYDNTNFITDTVAYLKHTYEGAITLQTSQVFETATVVQKNDLDKLKMFKNALQSAYSNLWIANKMILGTQKNNIAICWLLLGLMMIGATFTLSCTLFYKVPLVQAVVIALGVIISLLYTLAMVYQMLSRTRRDPTKFYFTKPSIAYYTGKA